MFFRISRTTSMQRVFDAYFERVNSKADSNSRSDNCKTKFVFGGVGICGHDTASSLGMEDGDCLCIDALAI